MNDYLYTVATLVDKKRFEVVKGWNTENGLSVGDYGQASEYVKEHDGETRYFVFRVKQYQAGSDTVKEMAIVG